MISKNLVTIVRKKPAKKGDDYHFSISREMIRTGTIDPSKTYELKIFEIDDSE